MGLGRCECLVVCVFITAEGESQNKGKQIWSYDMCRTRMKLRASPNRLGPLLFSATRTTHDAQACIEMCIKSDALSAECPSGKSALSEECQHVL